MVTTYVLEYTSENVLITSEIRFRLNATTATEESGSESSSYKNNCK